MIIKRRKITDNLTVFYSFYKSDDSEFGGYSIRCEAFDNEYRLLEKKEAIGISPCFEVCKRMFDLIVDGKVTPMTFDCIMSDFLAIM